MSSNAVGAGPVVVYDQAGPVVNQGTSKEAKIAAAQGISIQNKEVVYAVHTAAKEVFLKILLRDCSEIVPSNSAEPQGWLDYIVSWIPGMSDVSSFAANSAWEVNKYSVGEGMRRQAVEEANNMMPRFLPNFLSRPIAQGAVARSGAVDQALGFMGLAVGPAGALAGAAIAHASKYAWYLAFGSEEEKQEAREQTLLGMGLNQLILEVIDEDGDKSYYARKPGVTDINQLKYLDSGDREDFTRAVVELELSERLLAPGVTRAQAFDIIRCYCQVAGDNNDQLLGFDGQPFTEEESKSIFTGLQTLMQSNSAEKQDVAGLIKAISAHVKFEDTYVSTVEEIAGKEGSLFMSLLDDGIAPTSTGFHPAEIEEMVTSFYQVEELDLDYVAPAANVQGDVVFEEVQDA